jgi:hypothetical protein
MRTDQYGAHESFVNPGARTYRRAGGNTLLWPTSVRAPARLRPDGEVLTTRS